MPNVERSATRRKFPIYRRGPPPQQPAGEVFGDTLGIERVAIAEGSVRIIVVPSRSTPVGQAMQGDPC